MRLKVLEGGGTAVSEDNDNSDALGATQTRTMNRKGGNCWPGLLSAAVIPGM
jgi:hypothetical protein